MAGHCLVMGARDGGLFRMTGLRLRCIQAIIGAASLLASSAVSAGSISQSNQVSPWAALALLSGGLPAAAVCRPSARSAGPHSVESCVLQSVPIAGGRPVLQQRSRAESYGVTPLLLGLASIVAAAGFWFAVDDHPRHQRTPVSPD